MSDELNTKNLDQLIKALKDDLPRARVGILGAKAIRNKVEISGGKSINATSGNRPKTNFETATNAGIGALHEFGTAKMPMRSFLRVPISDNLQKKMESRGAFNKEELNQVVKEGSVLPWIKRIAILAEGIVAEAFATGGFGKWPAWRTPGYQSDSGRILDDTGQLRDSITSEVK